MCAAPPLARRPLRGTSSVVMPSFTLNIPPTSRDLPVEDIKAKDTERLFIDVDGNQISPFMTTEPGWAHTSVTFNPTTQGGPTGTTPTAAGAPGPLPAPLKSSRKFFRVDDKNMFIYIADEKPEQEQADSATAEPAPRLTKADIADTTEDSIPLEELEMLGPLGSGAQGTVRACRYRGVDYAIKSIPVTEALDKSQADVERQARKASIVRELKMVAKKKKSKCEHVVAVYNAYFQKKDLLILMERMTVSLEDIQEHLENLSWDTVKPMAQRIFGQHFSGSGSHQGRGTSSAGGGGGGGGGSGSGFSPVGSGFAAESFSSSDDLGTKSPIVKGSTPTTQPSRSVVGHYAQVNRRCPLPEVVLSLIAKDALLGLCNFHEDLKVVHTDLKPANLMFSQSMQTLKLADFGCNMELTEEGTVPHDSGVALGTKLYMSPERWAESGRGFDSKTDIWSLGITLLEMANGCHPCEQFKANFWTFQDMLKVEKMVRPQHCSTVFHDFFSKCLIRDPAKRPSARELLRHEFIVKFEKVPRTKLAQFIQTLAHEAKMHHLKEQRLKLSRFLCEGVQDRNNSDTRKKNMKAWRTFNSGQGVGLQQRPSLDDFPALS